MLIPEVPYRGPKRKGKCKGKGKGKRKGKPFCALAQDMDRGPIAFRPPMAGSAGYGRAQALLKSPVPAALGPQGEGLVPFGSLP